VTLRDYVGWHDEYERPGAPLHLRLLVVQDLVAQALDELPAGDVRVISMCAGQGRDLATVAARHRRGTDLTGRLVELDQRNVELGRTALARSGAARLSLVEGDAGSSDAYAGAAPADIVLVCGVFGNISRSDMERTVRERSGELLWSPHHTPGVAFCCGVAPGARAVLTGGQGVVRGLVPRADEAADRRVAAHHRR
jgi:hypothetical protein